MLKPHQILTSKPPPKREEEATTQPHLTAEVSDGAEDMVLGRTMATDLMARGRSRRRAQRGDRGLDKQQQEKVHRRSEVLGSSEDARRGRCCTSGRLGSWLRWGIMSHEACRYGGAVGGFV
jgi:hypothetical protein